VFYLWLIFIKLISVLQSKNCYVIYALILFMQQSLRMISRPNKCNNNWHNH